MKIIFLFASFLAAFVFLCGVSQARDLVLGQLRYQGEPVTVESNLVTIKGSDPAMIIPIDDEAKKNMLLTVEFKRTGKHNKIDLVYDRMQDGEKFRYREKIVLPAQPEFKDYIINLEGHKYFRGNIKLLALLFEGENQEVQIRRVQLDEITPKNFFYALFHELFEYRHFIPPTINFLQGPTLKGLRFNMPIVIMLMVLLALSLAVYFLVRSSPFKKKVRALFVVALVGSWFFNDLICTFNQIRLYLLMTDVESPMENARTYGVFTDFLEFIKKNTKKGLRGAFLAPYPASSEGGYHLYPHIRLAKKKGAENFFDYDWDLVDYIFVELKTGFGFKPPDFDPKKRELKFEGRTLKIKNIIPFDQERAILEVER